MHAGFYPGDYPGNYPGDGDIGGGWGDLRAITREARDPAFRRAGLLVACPNHGEPLISGPGGVRFCRFGGERF